VLVAKGMVTWMAAWASLPAVAADPGGTPATAPQADVSLSTATRSLSTPSTRGGEQSSSACTSLLSAVATAEIVSVLAQMTLAHARRSLSPDQEAVPP